MQARTDRSTFQVLEVALEAIRTLRPLVARVRARDRDLGEQLRRALSSVALKIAEGNQSRVEHRLERFSTAAGSTSEARTALRVAEAWGYADPCEIRDGLELLDGVAAMLHRLSSRN